MYTLDNNRQISLAHLIQTILCLIVTLSTLAPSHSFSHANYSMFNNMKIIDEVRNHYCLDERTKKKKKKKNWDETTRCTECKTQWMYTILRRRLYRVRDSYLRLKYVAVDLLWLNLFSLIIAGTSYDRDRVRKKPMYSGEHWWFSSEEKTRWGEKGPSMKGV